MLRAFFAVLTGLFIWIVAATAFNLLLRVALPGYASAEPSLDFTLGMMIARLLLPGGLPSLLAGYAGAWVAHGDRRATAALAGILVALFLPVHYQLWARFPLWYHVAFLGSLPVLTVAGAAVRTRWPRSPDAIPARAA